MSWSKQETETARKMWNEGESASAIAAVLNGKTRNAVIGKLSRMGDLGGVRARAKPKAPVRKTASKPEPKSPVVASRRAERDDLIPPAPPSNGQVTLGTVGFRQCRFPTGDASLGADMPMCGSRTEEGESYCKAHRRVAIQNRQNTGHDKPYHGNRVWSPI